MSMQTRQVRSAFPDLEKSRTVVVQEVSCSTVATAWGPDVLNRLVRPIYRLFWFNPDSGFYGDWKAESRWVMPEI